MKNHETTGHEANQGASEWDEVFEDEKKLTRPRLKPEVIKKVYERDVELRGDVLSLDIGDENISITTLKSFDPPAFETKEPTAPSPIAERVLHESEATPDTLTKTYEVEDWQSKMFSLVQECTGEELIGQLMEQEQISPDLQKLTPRQAVVLSSYIATLFTKYDEEQVSDLQSIAAHKEVAADQQDAMTLLAEGMKKYKNPDWQGNGVCRNFASITKAVFEALKAKQKQPSSLNNTYCVLRASRDGDLYRAGESGQNAFGGGHAWNEFVQISIDEQSMQALSIDVTAANIDLDTGQPDSLDWSSKRTKMISAILDKSVPRDNPDQLPVRQMLEYYDEVMRHETSRSARGKLAHQILSLIRGRNLGQMFGTEKSKEAISYAAGAFFYGSVQQFDQGELEQLFDLCGSDPDNMKVLVANYVKKKRASGITHPRVFRFSNEKLQALVNEALENK